MDFPWAWKAIYRFCALPKDFQYHLIGTIFLIGAQMNYDWNLLNEDKAAIVEWRNEDYVLLLCYNSDNNL